MTQGCIAILLAAQHFEGNLLAHTTVIAVAVFKKLIGNAAIRCNIIKIETGLSKTAASC